MQISFFISLLGPCFCVIFLGIMVQPTPAMAQETQSSEAIPIDKKYTRLVNKLANNTAIQKAFAYLEALEPKNQEDLILLNEIPAPPFKEEKRAQQYAQMLREAGADSVWMDAEGNVIALRKGTVRENTVALDAHLDTVFPEGTDVTVKIKGDTLYAPGIGDDTRGLVLVLAVLKAMEHEQIETEDDVLFIGTVGEEGLGDLRGVKYLFSEKGPGIDYWIAVDGGDIGRIVNKGLGSHRYKVTFEGPGGHSWGSFGLVNPAHALGRAIYHFSEGADAFTRQGPRTSFNVGRMGGGTSVNAIPFEAWMEVDMRSENNESLKQIDQIFQKAMQQALQEENEMSRKAAALTVDIEMIGNRPSGEISASDPLVQLGMATATFFGAKPSLGFGSTDSNIPIAQGVPGITIGRGGESGGAHALDEWWLNIDAHVAVQRALLLLIAQAGLAK